MFPPQQNKEEWRQVMRKVLFFPSSIVLEASRWCFQFSPSGRLHFFLLFFIYFFSMDVLIFRVYVVLLEFIGFKFFLFPNKNLFSPQMPDIKKRMILECFLVVISQMNERKYTLKNNIMTYNNSVGFFCWQLVPLTFRRKNVSIAHFQMVL